MNQRRDSFRDDDAIAQAEADAEAEDTAEAKAYGRALAMLRAGAGISQEEAGSRFGISGQGFRKYETGAAPTIFKPGTRRRLAQSVGSTIEQLEQLKEEVSHGIADMRGRSAPPISPKQDLMLLPVRDRVQAGAWLAADDHRQDEPAKVPVARDPRYGHANQWLSEVVGDSVNQLRIFDGDLVHVVDTYDISYTPKTNDVVEVERLRFQGSERELTLKQVEVTPGGVLLWPRSTNPRWKEPLQLRHGVEDHEDIEIRIRSLVVAVIRRL